VGDNPPKRTKRLAGTKYSFNELIQMLADTPAGKIPGRNKPRNTQDRQSRYHG
jgi:hypothetical protein